MRIYGGHDYYDCALALGSDPSVVLVRQDKVLPWRDVPLPRLLRVELTGGHPYPYAVRHFTVAFCSKVYRGVEVSGLYFWHADKLRSWAASRKKVLVSLRRPWQEYKLRSRIEDYFDVTDASESLREYMISNRYAILLETHQYDEPVVRMNPSGLKTLGFVKALDPYTAYQELSMWVGGVLAGESPKIVKVTDDRVLLEGHGFDNRISFRGPRI